MLATTHTLVSAAIITKVTPPYLSLPLVLISHYILDSIPHWDTGTGLTKGLKTKKTAFWETIVDLAIAGSLVFYLFQLNKDFSALLWFAFVLGITPDLVEFPVLFLNKKPRLLEKIIEFHDRFHQRAKLPWGLIPQIIIILAIIFLNLN